MTLGANENISLEQLHTSGTSPGGSRRTSLDSNINRAENTGTGRLPEGNGDGEDGDGHDLDEIDIHSIHDFDRKASGGPSGRRNSDFGQNFKKPQAEVVIQHNTLGSQTSTSTDRDSSDGGQLQCVANISFTEALLKEKPQKWTKTMFKLYFFLGVAFINSVINGYDASVMGGINTMETYKKYFNMEATGSDAGVVISSYVIGNIAGSFFCGPFTDWWGRRWGMFTGAAIVIMGACVQGSSMNRGMFVAGRFFLGFGVATCATAGPCYVVEMAHPAWRGPLTGFYNAFWMVGAVPATWATFASAKIPGELSWRLPIWFQALASSLLCLTCLFIPETPRWLYSNNRRELAVRVLEKYHGEGNRKSPIVALTYKELVEEVYIGGSDKRWWDYSELYNSKAAWWRNACVLGMAFCSQWAGNGALTYFMSNLLEQIGIEDEGTQLLYNAIFNVWGFVVSFAGACFVERLGRRRVLLVGTSLFVVWWTVITVLAGLYASKDNHNKTGARATVAFINLFQLTYSFAYTPLQALYPVECLSYETRAKGMGMYNLGVNCALFFITYGIPEIMPRIKWRFYIIYAGWNCCQVAWIYFFFVETKGRTLEEINEIFKASYPTRKSLEKHKVIVDQQKGILYRGFGQGNEDEFI